MLAAGAADAMDGLSFHPYDPTADGSGFPARFAALRAGGAAGLRLLPDEVGTLLSARRLVAEYQQLDGRDPRIPLVRAVDGFGAFTTVEKRDPSLAPYGFLSRKDPDGRFRGVDRLLRISGSGVTVRVRAAPLPRYVVGC